MCLQNPAQKRLMLMVTMYVFWIASSVLEALLVAYILRKKLHREFPIFFSFMVASTVSDLANFALSFISYRVYYYVYWTGMAITVALGYSMLHEVFKHVFRPYEYLRTFGSTLFRWSTIVLLMIGAVMALTSAPATREPITSYIFTIDRSVQIMQCGLVLFLYLFARQLGITQGHRVFGIAVGFGITAATHLIAVTLSPYFMGRTSKFGLQIAMQAAYLSAVILWTVYMWRKEPERRRASMLEQTESWNYALAAATSGDGGSSFLPSVVDTVERVLNKRAISISSDFRSRG